MENKFRIAIAEDCTILREGLRSLLGMSLDFEIVGEAEDGFAAKLKNPLISVVVCPIAVSELVELEVPCIRVTVTLFSGVPVVSL